MSVTVIIPARMGSSRFPGKPLALIAGQPLIQRCCQRAGQARGVDRVAVATDSEEIARVAGTCGLEVVLTGPDFRTGSDRVAQAARDLGLDEHDIVVNIQGDQPLIPPSIVEKTIQPLLDEPDLEMSTVAIPLDPSEKDDPGKVKVVLDRQGNALYFSRAAIPFVRDEGTRVDYLKHLGVYGFRNSFLQTYSRLPTGILEDIEKLEQLRALENGARIRVVLTREDSPAVDTPEDIRAVEGILDQAG